MESFVNGRALGGVMRSHHIPNQDQEEEKPSQLSDETESDVSSSEEQERNGFRDVENMVNLTRKRSKRTRKLESFTTKKMKIMESEVEVDEIEHPHSSASDTTTEEDLAFCLMMLSRDKWKNKKKRSYYQEIQDEEIEPEEESYKIKKGRYKCETCGKVFKSYQALGGHRASHKKNRVSNKTEFNNVVVVAVAADAAEKRVHQCPICFRVFASGQALGGHKRSHGIANNNMHHQVKQRMIDLNLPAPNEEQEEVSMVFQ